MKKKRAGKKVELVVGDLEDEYDFETPATRLHAYVRDDGSAARCLVLAAGVEGTDPVGYTFLPRGE